MARKKYSKEIKLNAIAFMLEQGDKKSDAARSLGINVNKLSGWINEHQSNSEVAFRGNNRLMDDQAEIQRL